MPCNKLRFSFKYNNIIIKVVITSLLQTNDLIIPLENNLIQLSFKQLGGFMFCRECGIKISEDSKFCKECGAPTSSEIQFKQGMPDVDELIITTQAVFVPWVSIISTIPIHLFLTVWACGFLGGFSGFAVHMIGLYLPPGSTFIFFGALAFFTVPAISYYKQKETYSRTRYSFYADRLEYSEGFWTIENKVIKYKNITEANMRKGILQKKYGLGTIVLSTPATGTQNGASRSGIKISDIRNVEEVYNKILP